MPKHSSQIAESDPVNALQDEFSATEQVTDPLLPLDGGRVIALHHGEKVLTYTFRRLTLQDWQLYFSSIVNKTVQLGGERETVYESESALLDLVARSLVDVDGYGDVSKLKDWRRSLPLGHRIAAGQVLRSVGMSESEEDELLLSDLIEVKIDAAWSLGEAGKTKFFTGLVHRFRQPSIEQLKKFNFESARVHVQGTSQDGISTYPSRHLVAMKIYDELIESVEGYEVGGKPLEGIDNIKREMDGAHKAEAGLALFTQGGQVSVH